MQSLSFIRSLFLSLIILCTTFTVIANQKNVYPVIVQKLTTTKPSKTIFRGTISPIKTGDLYTTHEGLLTFTASPGDTVFSQVKDENGKIIRKGTPVAIQNTSYKKIELDLAKQALKKSISQYTLDYENYKRNAKLTAGHAVSEKDFETSKNDFEGAKIGVISNQTELEKVKEDLDRCYIYPLFTGQVEKVYYPAGASIDSHVKVAKITAMNPVYVKLKLPAALTNMLSEQSEVTIHSNVAPNSISGLLTVDPLDATIVNILILNEIVPTKKIPKKYSGLPKIHKLRFVAHVFISKDLFEHGEKNVIISPLAVPVNTLHKDAKGCYVWKAIGQKGIMNKISETFKIKKIYVKPGNIVRKKNILFNLSGYYRSLEDAGELQKLDVIIPDVPNNVKDGDTVIYERLRWHFCINEKVAIEIQGLNKTGFYVPETAVFDITSGYPKVCIYDKGKVKYVSVELTGYHDRYVCIESPEIKEGTLVILDKMDALENIYNGASVMIHGYDIPPEKLEHNVPRPYNPISSNADTVIAVPTAPLTEEKPFSGIFY